MSKSEMQLFRPQPLTDEDRERLRVGLDTLYFLELDDGDFERPIEGEVASTFWVDSEFLSKVQGGSDTAKYFQKQIALEFVRSVIVAYQQHNGKSSSWDDAQDTLLGAIVLLLAENKKNESELRELLKLTIADPVKVIARAEHIIGLRSSSLAVLRK